MGLGILQRGTFYVVDVAVLFIFTTMPQKTNLVIVVPSLKCGGAENFVAQLCSFIDTNLFVVHLIVLNNEEAFYAIDSKVNIIDLKAKRAATHIFTLTAAISRLKPNVILSVSNHVSLLLSIFRFLLPAKAKLVGWETSIPSVNAPRVRMPIRYNWLMKKFFKKLPVIVCQSNAIQQDLMNNYGCKADQVPVISTGVAIPKWQAEQVINLPILFLTVARLSLEKGIADIIKMLSQFSEPFTYCIVGDGSCREELELLVTQLQLQEKVFFIGAKQNPYEGFEEADLFLMASHFEGLPTTLMEATAYGIPVIAFEAPGGIAEIVTHGLNGFLVKERKTEAYLAAIKVALTHPFDRFKIRQNTIEKFDNRITLQQLQNLLINLAGQ